MFFGLCNSLATFQTMMNEIFQDMIHERWIIIYMDDIFIFTKTIKENVKCIKRVLQWLVDNNSKARKMYLLDERSGISRNDHFRKSITNGPSQTLRNSRMACINKCQKRQIIPQIWKLLSPVHTRLWEYHKTTKRSSWQKQDIWMEPRMSRHVWITKKEISGITGASNAWHDETIRSRERCIKICIRSSTQTTR